MGKENTNKAAVNEERQPFSIEVVEHEIFKGISSTMFTTSTDFCHTVTQLFKSAYSDAEASRLEVYTDQQTRATYAQVTLFFNHAEREDDDRVPAITRTPEDGQQRSNNAILRRSRRLDQQYRSGDRYYLTQEGKDGIAKFLFDNQAYNRKGKVDWGKIVAETTIPSNFLGQPNIPATGVSFLDPSKLAAEIYGRTDENGRNYTYIFQTGSSIPSMGGGYGQSNKFGIQIMRLSEEEVARLSNELGLTFGMGISVVR